jgi:hypothetical protein
MNSSKDKKTVEAKKVDYGKPSGHLDTQIFPGWDPVKHQREKNKKRKNAKK